MEKSSKGSGRIPVTGIMQIWARQSNSACPLQTIPWMGWSNKADIFHFCIPGAWSSCQWHQRQHYPSFLGQRLGSLCPSRLGFAFCTQLCLFASEGTRGIKSLGLFRLALTITADAALLFFFFSCLFIWVMPDTCLFHASYQYISTKANIKDETNTVLMDQIPSY